MMEHLFPSAVLAVLSCLTPVFSKTTGRYFRGFVLATMLLGQTRKCMTNIARVCFFIDRHISSWERFLSQYSWALPPVQDRVVNLIRAQMGRGVVVHGAILAWVDTTLVAKARGTMRGVQKWHDHSGNPDRGTSLVGHHWAVAGLMGTTVLAGKIVPLCWPLVARLISGHADPLGFVVNAQGVAQVMTFWDAVCPAVAHLQTMLSGLPMRVVADAYFAKAPFLNWMLALKIQVITRMRHDAVGWEDPVPDPPGVTRRGPKRKHPKKGLKWGLATLLDTLPHETITVSLSRQVRTLTVVSRDLWIRGVECQKVRIVVVQTKGEPVILLSTDLTLPPASIVELYGLRFPAELALRNLKQFFGLEDYQCPSLLAITRFVGLSLISYCVWQLVSLQEQEAAWLQPQESRTPLSFVRLSRSVRRFVVGKLFANSACDGEFHNYEAVAEQLNRLFV